MPLTVGPVGVRHVAPAGVKLHPITPLGALAPMAPVTVAV